MERPSASQGLTTVGARPFSLWPRDLPERKCGRFQQRMGSILPSYPGPSEILAGLDRSRVFQCTQPQLPREQRRCWDQFLTPFEVGASLRRTVLHKSIPMLTYDGH